MCMCKHASVCFVTSLDQELGHGHYDTLFVAIYGQTQFRTKWLAHYFKPVGTVCVCVRVRACARV